MKLGTISPIKKKKVPYDRPKFKQLRICENNQLFGFNEAIDEYDALEILIDEEKLAAYLFETNQLSLYGHQGLKWEDVQDNPHSISDLEYRAKAKDLIANLPSLISLRSPQ